MTELNMICGRRHGRDAWADAWRKGAFVHYLLLFHLPGGAHDAGYNAE